MIGNRLQCRSARLDCLKIGVACVWAALLAGCATRTKEEALSTAGIDIPAEFTSKPARTQTAEMEDGWADLFYDAALNDLIEEALAVNPGFLAARAIIEAKPYFEWRFAPDLTLNADGGRTYSDRDSDGERARRTRYSMRLGSEWEIDLWGRVVDSYRADLLRDMAEDEEFRGLEISLAASVARLWYGVHAADLRYALAQRNLEVSRNFLDVTEKRYQGGVSDALATRSARSTLASSSAALIAAEQNRNTAQRGLEVVLGRYPAAEVQKRREGLPELRMVKATPTPAFMLENRPDLLAAESRMKAAGIQVHIARKALLPTLNLSLSANNENPSLAGLFDIDDIAGSILVNLTQPILARGRILAAYSETKAQAKAAVYRYVEAALRAAQEVETLIEAEEALAVREIQLARAADEATQAEQLGLERYRSGALDFFSFLDLQRRRITAEESLIALRLARVTNRIDFYAAFGKQALSSYGEQPVEGE